MTKNKGGLLLHLSKFPHKYGAQGQTKTYISTEVDTWKEEHEKLCEEVVSQIQALFNEMRKESKQHGRGETVTLNLLEEKIEALLVSPSPPTSTEKVVHCRNPHEMAYRGCSDRCRFFVGCKAVEKEGSATKRKCTHCGGEGKTVFFDAVGECKFCEGTGFSKDES